MSRQTDLITSFFLFDERLGEQRNSDALDSAFKEFHRYSWNAKEVALVLFHTAKAIDRGVYGDTEEAKSQARRVVDSHIQGWTDKTVKAFEKRASGLDIKVPQCIATQYPTPFHKAPHINDFLGIWVDSSVRKHSNICA
ncbi:MAG: hypothetical protein EOM26_01725, partial [Alphaproteobacteria bacterium]|nr:hypothetical protein [Alphaproteobacteria bacterium]